MRGSIRSPDTIADDSCSDAALMYMHDNLCVSPKSNIKHKGCKHAQEGQQGERGSVCVCVCVCVFECLCACVHDIVELDMEGSKTANPLLSLGKEILACQTPIARGLFEHQQLFCKGADL